MLICTSYIKIYVLKNFVNLPENVPDKNIFAKSQAKSKSLL